MVFGDGRGNIRVGAAAARVKNAAPELKTKGRRLHGRRPPFNVQRVFYGVKIHLAAWSCLILLPETLVLAVPAI